MSSYATILRDALRVRWNLDEVTAAVAQMDLGQRLLPEDLVRADRLEFLDDRERLVVNHIRAHSYVQLFALVEKFIVPFVMSQAGHRLYDRAEEFLALMQFGEEEAKHIALFERYAVAFENAFGSTCQVVGPAQDVVAQILTRDVLGVALATLHIEWMTQEHYVSSVRDSDTLDEQFKNLLKYHWLEEAQHARIDALLIAELAQSLSNHERLRAVTHYLEIVDILSTALGQQVGLDIAAFEKKTGRTLRPNERSVWDREQHESYRAMFLYQGISHPRFAEVIDEHFGESVERVAQARAGLAPR